MNSKLTSYLNGVFTPYEGVKSVTELKADLHADLQERYNELRAEGKDEETAYKLTIESIGDIEQTILEVSNLSRSLERQLLTNFSASNLADSDFAGVTARKGQFNASALRGSDFAGADLTGSTFKSSDVREANFDGANLTGARFDGQTFIGVKFNKVALTEASFRGASFHNVSFHPGFVLTNKYYKMIKTICFDGATMDKLTYNALKGMGADLSNVSVN
ncbi:pentapeptide repeat-containing protein [Paenibacillus sp. CF384]|uniref:pentapeptide repeat-containing protein n=1 Tax=Paenibacillus sp. CF384 TaxID=1884382 RepID=UPI000898C044|nr:pentapeptide repeat-containing protein [Paenibacillus sp. CF384]SDX39549.1 Uncharacterized protein YjbI, contains pentapeptide repeats [Paenibacillus sp. CF384]